MQHKKDNLVQLVCFLKVFTTFFDTFHNSVKRLTLTPLLCKSMDWFLYDGDLHHEKVNALCTLKGQTYFNKPKAFSCRFKYVCSFSGH